MHTKDGYLLEDELWSNMYQSHLLSSITFLPVILKNTSQTKLHQHHKNEKMICENILPQLQVLIKAKVTLGLLITALLHSIQ
jgi:hypothetical protein